MKVARFVPGNLMSVLATPEDSGEGSGAARAEEIRGVQASDGRETVTTRDPTQDETREGIQRVLGLIKAATERKRIDKKESRENEERDGSRSGRESAGHGGQRGSGHGHDRKPGGARGDASGAVGASLSPAHAAGVPAAQGAEASPHGAQSALVIGDVPSTKTEENSLAAVLGFKRASFAKAKPIRKGAVLRARAERAMLIYTWTQAAGRAQTARGSKFRRAA